MTMLEPLAVAKLTPEGHVNMQDASHLMARFYAKPDELKYHVGRLWSALVRTAYWYEVPFDGYCVICNRHVASRERVAKHRYCGLEAVQPYHPFVFNVDSLFDKAMQFLDGGPFKNVGPTIKVDFCRLMLLLEEQRTGSTE